MVWCELELDAGRHILCGGETLAPPFQFGVLRHTISKEIAIMSIIRVHKKENPFVQIDKTCLEDPSLSWKAKGLHAYLIGKPDDWTVRLSHLAKVSKEGRDATRTGLAELEEAGYVKKELSHDKAGKFTGSNWDVYETPFTDYPNTDEAVVGLSNATNKKNLLKNEASKSSPTTSKQPLPSTQGAPDSQVCEKPEVCGELEPDNSPAPKPEKGGVRERKVTWLTPYNDIHIAVMGGDIKNFGQFARDITPIVKKYGADRTAEAWRKHLEEEGKFASSSHFASKPLVWMDKKKKMVEHVDTTKEWS